MDLPAKKLGFGLMRLPKKDNVIDVEQVKEMVDIYMDAGFTYFDTAWAYNGSEVAMREALVKRYPRQSFTVATKMSAWAGEKTREFSLKQFETSLEQTGAGYFDYYLLHNLGDARTPLYDDFGLWDFVREKKAKGEIKNFGFSFHSNAAALDKVLATHPDVDFVQLQINYADWEDGRVQSRECYETARRYGVPVVVMEPVKGGLLADPPASVAEVFKAADPKSSYASWAIRFAASLEGVAVVLSGMSTVDQVKDNVSFMADFKPLDEEEQKIIEKARIALKSIPTVPCTGCNYCAEVCPSEIGISPTLNALNMFAMYNNKQFARAYENRQLFINKKNHADMCIRCGACESVCPQHIDIREHLERACSVLGPFDK
ncbi:MAG: aldo/keto reductase [Clostridia bacterium]|nr:aldo/keto reductase [Clostridia bacterium]